MAHMAREYVRACRTDPTLPPFREEENRAEQSLPQEYLDQQAEGVGPCRCGECGQLLRGVSGSKCPQCGEEV